MSWIAPMIKNTVGLIVTVFAVRILDSLTTLFLNGERLSSMIAGWMGVGN